MSLENQTTKKKGGKPTYVAYQVRGREGEKGIFTRLGAAWGHGDGNGFNIRIDSVPLDGRIVLRTPSEKKE